MKQDMKKGFTLIELLAVIVILAIIALIAVPVILGVIDKAKKGAFKDSVLNAFNSVEYKLAEMKLTQIPESGLAVTDLPLKSNFVSGAFHNNNGVIVASCITDGKYYASGTMDNLVISDKCTIDASQFAYTFTPAEGTELDADAAAVTNVQQALDYLYEQ